MKLKLNIEELNEDFFNDVKLFGIIAPLKNYLFCWQINNLLGVKFALNNEIEIHLRRKKRDYFFNIYDWKEPGIHLNHYLYHNQNDGEYLLPEFKHIDYLWMMKGTILDVDRANWIKSSIKNISGVQLVTEIMPEQIVTKGNMVF